jgi:hypothetical protein
VEDVGHGQHRLVALLLLLGRRLLLLAELEGRDLGLAVGRGRDRLWGGRLLARG